MFFVLSGFLITWLLLKEHARTDTVSLRGSNVRRTLRIVPVFWAYWLAMVAFETLRDKPIAWAHAVSALLYVSNYYSALVGDPPSKAFTHTWSLSVEEQLDPLWPAMFIAFFCRARRADLLLVAIIAAIWGLPRGANCSTRAPVGVPLVLLLRFRNAVRCDARRMPYSRSCCRGRRLGRFWGLVTAHPMLLVITVLAAAIVSTVASVDGNLVQRSTSSPGHSDPFSSRWGLSRPSRSAATRGWRWLESPIARYLGLISYSLYLWQQWTLVRSHHTDHPCAVRRSGSSRGHRLHRCSSRAAHTTLLSDRFCDSRTASVTRPVKALLRRRVVVRRVGCWGCAGCLIL